MNLPLHLCRKDFRHTRWWLLITLLVSAGALWYPTVPIDDREDVAPWLMLFRYGGWLLLVPTIGRLMLRDAPLRDTGFLRTKPVSPAVLLGSKALVILALIMPMAFCECAMLLLLGLKPAIGDLFLIFAENLLSLTTIAAVTVAMIVRKRTTAGLQTSAVFWCIVAFLGWIAAMWAQNAYHRQHKPEWSYSLEYLKLSRLLIAQILAAAGMIAGLFLFIRARRGITVSASLATAAVCAIAAWYLWPVNFVKAATTPMREAVKSEWPDPAKLKFSFTESEGWSRQGSKSVMKRYSFSAGGYNDTTYRSIQAYSRLEGLPVGWKGFWNSYQSELTLPNGHIVPSKRESWGPLYERYALPLVGIPFSNSGKNPTQVDLAEFPLPAAGGAMAGAKLKGTLEIPLKRPVILARMPLRKNTTARFGGRLLHIKRVQIIEDKINYNLVIETPLVHSRGGFFAGPDLDFRVLVVHPTRKEFLDSASGGSSNQNHGHYAIQDQHFTQTIWQSPENWQNDRTIPAGWLDGAELLIVGSESGGSISQSFDFSDVPLGDQ